MSKTNAPTIHHLEGMSYQLGGSAAVMAEGIPIAAGADINLIPYGDTVYWGTTTYRGVSTPSESVLSTEGHIGMSYTHTIPFTQFNIFDIAYNVIDWMKDL